MSNYFGRERPAADRLARLVTPFLVRSTDEDKGTFSGWASTTALDSYGTILAPGAFDESIAEYERTDTRPALLAQHDWSQVPGRILELQSKPKDGGFGLWMDAAFELGTQLGRDYNLLIQPKPRPALNGLSVGFEPDWDAIDWIDDVLVFKRAKLWEVSVVTFPANDEARIENALGGLNLENDEAMRLFMRHAAAGGIDIRTERDLELALRDAGRSRSDAKTYASRFKPKAEAPRDAVDQGDLHTLRNLAAIFS